MSSDATRRPDAPRRPGPRRRLSRHARAREERRWRAGAIVLGVLAAASWLVLRLIGGELRPGSLPGMIYGGVATALLLLAMLYAVRRRLMPAASKRGWGLARSWLLAHVYGSLLFLLAMLLHSGLGWPEGLLSWSLWLLSVWTVVSGLIGLAAQRALPRLLTSGSGIEAHFERIPELAEQIRSRCDELVAAGAAPVRVLYERRLAPALAAPTRNPMALLSSGRARRRLEPLSHLRDLVSEDERDRLDELERLYTAKLDLDTHYALQHLLRGWLWLHVPPAALLFVLVLVHIASVLYY